MTATNFAFYLGAFAATLGILIVVHELGHFAVARLVGVKVLRFSVGFGRPLVIARFGADQTEWAISVFPLGGYVKMLDEREGPVEAHWLFNAPAERIEVVIHPQSVIHSLVDYEDGSVLAQLGNPDMRTPIAHALAWPQRIDSGVAPLDLFAIGQLNFERPDLVRFPCLDLAYRALRAEGNAAAVLNAANEVAVAAFLERRLPFLGIAELIAATLDAVPQAALPDLAAVLEADRQGRAMATEILARLGAAAR